MKCNLKKKVIACCLAIVMSISFNNYIFVNAAASVITSNQGEETAGYINNISGDGTESSPYIISDASQLQAVSNNLSAYYKLACNIDLGGVMWKPIGTLNNNFTGHFDGSGYTISNFNVSSSSKYSGFFGVTNNADIKNITLNNFTVIGKDYTGGLIGYEKGTAASIINCHVRNANVKGSNYYTGGLIGYINTGVIKNSSAIGVINGGNEVGGLAGYVNSKVIIENCFTLGNVKGKEYVAGIIGRSPAQGNSITNCYSAAKFSGEKYSTGIHTGNIKINNCYYDAEAAGESNTITSADVDRLTSAMLSKSNYKGWDFDTVWAIDEGESYPYLRSTLKPDEVKVSSLVSQGTGTEADPYIITNKEQLNLIRYNLSAYYKLMNDINLNRTVWKPVGTNSFEFTGHFDGNGYKVSNFTVSSSSKYMGFFGVTKNADIKNITLSNFIVTGGDYTGGLVGYENGAAGSITNCHIRSGNVKGDSYVGGLVGYCNTGNIKSSSSIGIINGNSNVGGLVGYVNSSVAIENCFTLGNVNAIQNGSSIIGKSPAQGNSITNCYSAAKFSGSNTGEIHSGTIKITNCYYDAEKSGIVTDTTSNNTVIADIDRLTSAMVTKANYKDWDFDNIWAIDEGHSYPYLRSTSKPNEVNVSSLNSEGIGTEANPYIITTKEQLNLIRYNLTAYYKLMNDIDLEDEDWEPVGTSRCPFGGHLDGNGHTISNFNIMSTSDNNAFFAYTNNAVITNLTLSDFIVTGGNYSAGLIAYEKNEAGSIINCHVINGNVKGGNDVGGLVGYYNGGNIKNSSSIGKVNGKNEVGGLVGYLNSKVTVENCFTIGNVKGTQYVAGIIGKSTSSSNSINNSYSAAKTIGTSYTSGVYNGSAKTSNCYYDAEVSKLINTTSLDTNRLTSAMRYKDNYKEWDFDNVWAIDEGKSYPYLRDTSKPSEVSISSVGIEGKGTEESPYIIKTKEQLKLINYYLKGYFILENNIDLEGEEWNPIARNDIPFTGHLDGKNHIVSNFTINNNKDYTGFFAAAKNAEISNFNLDNFVVSGVNYVGGLIGNESGSASKLTNCHLTKAAIMGGSYVGGIAGSCEGSMNKCSFSGTIDAYGNYAGGAAGYAPSIVSYKDCNLAVKSSVDLTPYPGSSSHDGNHYARITGSGTETDPYVIPSGGGLSYIDNHPDANYELQGDISGDGLVIDPIGRSENPFTGIFNGNGHTISNIIIGGGGAGGAGGAGGGAGGNGLFGYTSGGTIKGVNIKDVKVNGDDNATGALVGYNNGTDITFIDCHITDTVINAHSYVGSLIGGSNGKVIIIDCSSDIIINAEGSYIGGLAGACKPEISKSYFTGTINATGNYIGGLAGYASGGTFEESYSSAIVNGDSYVGGMIGTNGNSAISILNCYVAGSLKGSSYIGGIIGYSSAKTTMTNAYAAEKMEGADHIGGLESDNKNLDVTSCYYDTQVSGLTDTTSWGRKTNVMIYRPNFINWNFDGIWSIKEGETYPYLRQMEIPEKVERITADGCTVNANTGKAAGGLTINIRQGTDNKTGEIISTVVTGSDGKFKIDNLSKGDYTGEVIGDGYITRYFNFSCSEEENNIGDISIMPVMTGNQMKIVLSWGKDPEDLDSHFKGAGQEIDFGNRTGTGASLDVDDTTSYGPETITIDFDKLLQGTYTYYVKWYSGNGTWATSKAKVQVYLDNALVNEFTPSGNLLNGKTNWNVFTLDSSTKTITPINN